MTSSEQQQQHNAYLEIVLGPMFSGKSSFLQQQYTKYSLCNIPTLVINHTCDAPRYNDDLKVDNTYLITHDKHKIPCRYVSSLGDIESHVVESHVVFLINEGQFFAELRDFVELLMEKNKIVFVCGLDGDFRRAKFGQMLDIIPLSDKVTKLASVCVMCKQANKPAIFTMRTDSSQTQNQVLVGGSESYKPVCRNCYVHETSK